MRHWRLDRHLVVVDSQSEGIFDAKPIIGSTLESLIDDPVERRIALDAHRAALSDKITAYEAIRGSETFLVCVEPEPGQAGCRATAMQITLYKQQEQSIGKLKRHIESILNAAGEGIYGLDLEGKATFVNPAAIEMTGWSAEETIGHNIHYKHHHSYPDGSPYPHTACPIYAAINDGEVHEVSDELFWRKDGSSFPVEYTSTPIYDEGKLSGAVVVFKDITERKEAERKLLEAFREVEQLKEQLQEYNTYLQEEIREEHNFGQIIGSSDALKRVMHQVNQVAATTATVLITGESGTGKELISRSIHDLSPRHDQALVKINCGAIAEGLVESELFGHEKGAFTHALSTRRGRFELADGGTLLLDEVGELPLSAQVKLLRVLQEQEVVRVGGSEPVKVDVRIIAATNRDLVSMVQQGEFREDLYYRLNLFPIEVPPLRERRDDIEPLARHFLAQAARKFGKPLRRIRQTCINQLERYSWPGNIRELQNMIERAVILAEGDQLEVGPLIPQVNVTGKSKMLTLREMEIYHIKQALKITSGVISGPRGAAELLAIHPNTLRSRMQKLGIQE
ncbi:MAG: sigma 54-interacting transcriptional regulator [Chromatiales bacterium]|nr:sigma 54-interacting transcriptional regulator [Chromatiales bacterium]